MKGTNRVSRTGASENDRHRREAGQRRRGALCRVRGLIDESIVRWDGRRVLAVFVAAACWGCGIFEPRPAEDPSGSSTQFPPATEARIVITNLQHAIEQRSVPNYIQCFADPFTSPQQFSFIPSSDGNAQYATVFRVWTITEEQAYFQNLSARTTSTTRSRLDLSEKSFITSGDSALAEYGYTLTFEHTDPLFPKIARGNMQLALARNNNNIWSVFRWADFKTTSDATWSLFKGKFSN